MTYDPINRISTAQTAATTGQDCWGLGYTNDQLGNLTAITPSKCSGPNLSVSVDQSTNQISTTGYSYDAAGDATADGAYTYTYNAENQVTSAGSVDYTYDGNGMRVEKSSGTLYWRDFGGAVIEETDTSGNVQRDYIFFDKRRVAWKDSSSNAYYYFADKLGSTRVVTSSSGSTCFEADYYPYGAENDYTTSCSPTYKFAGYEFDSETSNYYAYSRYYDPRIGRFLSADPSGSAPGMPGSPTPDISADAVAIADDRAVVADRRRSWLLGGVYGSSPAPQTNGLLWNPAAVSGLMRVFPGRDVTHSGLWVTAEEVAAMELARANPQGWNGYAYVLGNPTTLTDTLGLDSPPSLGRDIVEGAFITGAVACAAAAWTVIGCPTAGLVGIVGGAAGGVVKYVIDSYLF